MKKMIKAFAGETIGRKIVSVILLSFMFFAMCARANAEVTRNGNTFVQTSTRATGSAAEQTKYNYEYNGKTYPIFITKNGRTYINAVSKKTGKEYRKYLDEQTSRTICAEMGREYVDKTSK